MKRKLFPSILTGICWAALAVTTNAQVPGIINYQGRVSVSGTNFNGAGQFEFALVDGGNNASVQIPSGGGCAAYQLQVTPSLKPATWTNVGASQGGTGGVLSFTDTGGATNRPGRFYRIDITVP